MEASLRRLNIFVDGLMIGFVAMVFIVWMWLQLPPEKKVIEAPKQLYCDIA